MPDLSVSLREAVVQGGLHTSPEIATDERGVDAPIAPAVPVELARVDGIAQDLVNGSLRHGVLALAEDHPLGTGHAGDLRKGMAPCRVPLEQSDDDGSQVWIGLDCLFPVRAEDIAVAERSERGPDTLLGLLQHSLPRLLREVVDIVLGHQHLDAMNELF